MKKVILVLVASVCSFQLWSQGTLQLTSGATIKVSGNAFMVLDNMHLVNNGSLQQTIGNGIVKLTGSQSINLSGSSNATINQLILAKRGSASLNLQSNLSVVSNITFGGGLINLGNNSIDLSATGILIDESESSRAFTTGTGFIMASGVLNSPSAANLGNLGAVITADSKFGNTIIKRGHKVQTGISGNNNSIRRYFDITPTNNIALKATLRFYYFDAELNGLAEATLNHWQSPDLVNWNLMGANARDAVANYVEQKTYGKFQRITLATATGPILICPINQSVVANAKSGCNALVSLESFGAAASGIPTPVISFKIGNNVIASPYLFPKGTTVVTVVAANGVLPDITCTFTVTVICGGGANTKVNSAPIKEETAEKFSVTARPNPSSNNFFITVQTNKTGKIIMQVLDIYGRVIETRNVTTNSIVKFGDRYIPGTYFLRIMQGKEHKEVKLLKMSD